MQRARSTPTGRGEDEALEIPTGEAGKRWASEVAAEFPRGAMGNGQAKVKEKSHLLEFYGIECDHCVEMEPVLEELNEETGLTTRKFEVWYNDDNLRLLQRLDRDAACGGVPFYYNMKTRGWVCGATTYTNFKAFALGKHHERFLPPPPKEEAPQVFQKFRGVFDKLRTEGMERMQKRTDETGEKHGPMQKRNDLFKRGAFNFHDFAASRGGHL